VLTEAELAELLRFPSDVIGRLLAETDLPRVAVAGELRFLRDQVLAWLGEQRAPLLADAPEVPSSRAPGLEGLLPGADEAEGPFVSEDALAALGPAPSRPEDNLRRLQARDGLIAVADALLPSLGRRSGGRLSPSGEPGQPTSAWRAEDVAGAPIASMTFGFSEHDGPPPSESRPRLELTLEAGAVVFALVAPGDAGALGAEALDGARAAGAELGESAPGQDLALRFRHRLGDRPPTLSALVARLDADARHLVPLWLAAADGREAGGA
jgi:hypothetical protein